MENNLEAQHIVPQELGRVESDYTFSLANALEIIKFSDTRGLEILYSLNVNEKEEKSLKLLPEAITLNRRLKMLEFSNFKVDDIMVAEVLNAGVRNDNVIYIIFGGCKKFTNERLLESMCEGFRERSTTFQLELNKCSPEFVKPIIEASYERCFSLRIYLMDCAQIQHGLRNFFLKSRLYYIYLTCVRGLKEDVFLQLGRSLLPNVIKLNLRGTNAPPSALKRLHGFLKRSLDSGRSNLFEKLHLGATELGNKLSFAYIRLLRSDIVGMFKLNLKKDISRAVVRDISATVANTKNLRYLYTGRRFSSGTKFKNFKLQELSYEFRSPCGVNPTVA